MASIEQRGNAWRVVWRHNGVKQFTTWDTIEDAEQAADVARAHRHQVDAEWLYREVGGIEAAEPEVDRGPTVAAWAETWLASRTRVSPGTLKRYGRQIEARVVPELGDRLVVDVTPTDVGRFLNGLRGDSIKTTATVTRYYAVLSGLFKGAVSEGIRPDNPVSLTDFIRDQTDHDDTGEGKQVRLTPAEFGLLRTAFEENEQPLIDILAGTGARWSEATALAVKHYLPATTKSGARIRIWRAWKGGAKDGGTYLGTTKGRSKRELGVTKALALVLDKVSEGRQPDDLLITAPEGGKVLYHNWRDRSWDPAVVRAMRCAAHPPAPQESAGEFVGLCGDHGGLRSSGKRCGGAVVGGFNRCRWHLGPARNAVSSCDCPGVLHRWPNPHDLRHTHAAWLFSNPAVTPLAISRRLGHAQLSTTSELYGDLMPEAQEATVDAIAAALGDEPA